VKRNSVGVGGVRGGTDVNQCCERAEERDGTWTRRELVRQQATEGRGLLSGPALPATHTCPPTTMACHTRYHRSRAEQDGEMKRTSKGWKEGNACEEREQAGEQVADGRAMAKRTLRVQTREQLVG
jgi:hypothetical protein